MGRVDMKLLLQIVVIAVVSYQTIAKIPYLCELNAKCGAVGGICSVFSPGKDWVSKFVCDRYTRCRCWVKKSPDSCNGFCKNKGDQCSTKSPGFGWKNTGQICDWKSGCTCWTRTTGCNGVCRNRGERCSKFAPGKDWSNTGQVCDKANGCTCWKKCHDDKCKAMGGICNERSPGFGWWKMGRCQGSCSCWIKRIISIPPPTEDLLEII